MAATTLLLMMDFRIYEIEIDLLNYRPPKTGLRCRGGEDFRQLFQALEEDAHAAAQPQETRRPRDQSG